MFHYLQSKRNSRNIHQYHHLGLKPEQAHKTDIAFDKYQSKKQLYLRHLYMYCSRTRNFRNKRNRTEISKKSVNQLLDSHALTYSVFHYIYLNYTVVFDRTTLQFFRNYLTRKLTTLVLI